MGNTIPFRDKPKAKKPIPRKKPEERMKENHTGLLNTIITQTFGRDVELSEKDFLTKLGFDPAKTTEAEAIRIGKFNVLVEIGRVMLNCVNQAIMINDFYRTYLIENDAVELTDDAPEEVF